MAVFQRRPVRVEAVQWLGDNFDDVRDFVDEGALLTQGLTVPDLLLVQPRDGARLTLWRGDWLLRDKRGRLYTCRPELFERDYEAVT